MQNFSAQNLGYDTTVCDVSDDIETYYLPTRGILVRYNFE